MMAEIRTWWNGRSPREQLLLAIMLVLLVVVLLIFVVILPLSDGIASARARLAQAALTSGQIETRIAILDKAKRTPAVRGAAPLAALVTAAAQEAGFTLDRANAQGDDRVAIAIPAAKSPALFAWLAGLNARGIFAETITVRRNADATVAVEALLRARRP